MIYTFHCGRNKKFSL